MKIRVTIKNDVGNTDYFAETKEQLSSVITILKKIRKSWK